MTLLTNRAIRFKVHLAMDPQDRVDLSNINKPKNQSRLPNFKNSFKKNSAGPGRDAEGKFTTGSGGLIQNKNFKWSRALPLIIIVALAGGYTVYRSFAGSYQDCLLGGDIGYERNAGYAEKCVTDSDEAQIIRLYHGVFARSSDKAGRDYWVARLNGATKPKLTLVAIAKQFMGSSEFKNKYGALSNQRFVEAMYPQVFGRAPDAAGLAYWVGRLNNQTVTREAMMTSFTQSPEMKEAFKAQVAMEIDLGGSRGIGPSFGTKLKDYSPSEITCYGKRETDAATKRPVCTFDVPTSNNVETLVIGGANIPSTVNDSLGKNFAVCTDRKLSSSSSGSNYPSVSTVASPDNVVSNPSKVVTTYPYGLGIGYNRGFERYCIVQKNNPAGVNAWYHAFNRLSPNDKAGFALDSIALYEIETSISSPRFQNQSILSTSPQQDQLNSKVALPGSLSQIPVYTMKGSLQSYWAKSTSPQPVWSSVHAAFAGENKIDIMLNSLGAGKTISAEYVVTDVSTGRRIPIDHYIESYYDETTGVWKDRSLPKSQILTRTNSSGGYVYIYPIFKLERPTKVKIEIKVYNGELMMTNGVYVTIK